MINLEELKEQIKTLYKKQHKYLHPINLTELNKINNKIYKLRQLYFTEKQRQAESQQTAKF